MIEMEELDLINLKEIQNFRKIIIILKRINKKNSQINPNLNQYKCRSKSKSNNLEIDLILNNSPNLLLLVNIYIILFSRISRISS